MLLRVSLCILLVPLCILLVLLCTLVYSSSCSSEESCKESLRSFLTDSRNILPDELHASPQESLQRASSNWCHRYPRPDTQSENEQEIHIFKSPYIWNQMPLTAAEEIVKTGRLFDSFEASPRAAHFDGHLKRFSFHDHTTGNFEASSNFGDWPSDFWQASSRNIALEPKDARLSKFQTF